MSCAKVMEILEEDEKDVKDEKGDIEDHLPRIEPRTS